LLPVTALVEVAATCFSSLNAAFLELLGTEKISPSSESSLNRPLKNYFEISLNFFKVLNYLKVK